MDVRNILDVPSLYALWQAPFVAQKIRPFLDAVNPIDLGKVLEIGCGPGTNAALFAVNEYLGLDLSSDYVATARARFGDRFQQADASDFEVPELAPFDTVFINSLLHHLSDDQVVSCMSCARRSLSVGGELHLLDLVLPDETSLARTLAQYDRGDYPRPAERWAELVATAFEVQTTQPYPIRGLGARCWQMVYIRAVRRETGGQS